MTKNPSTAYRTPEIVPASWYLNCPGCGEGLPSPGGSLMWTLDSFRGPSVVCECGARCRIPARFRRDLPIGGNDSRASVPGEVT